MKKGLESGLRAAVFGGRVDGDRICDIGRRPASEEFRRPLRRRALGRLATLSLALFKQGGIYVSEGRSMMIGALASPSVRWSFANC